MRLSIISSDAAVYVDGISYAGLDLSCPTNVHALQWANGSGWIEFKNESEFRKPQNENIDVLPDWALAAKAKWDEAYVAEQEAVRAAENQPAVGGAETL